MEITPAGSSASAPIEAQVRLQKSASSQKEAVVSTILDGAKESAAKAEATGRNLLAVA